MVHTTRRIVADPRQLGAVIRERSMALWASRGGGFFGLGYLVAFVTLEIGTFADEIVGATDVATLLGQQLFEVVFRFASESFLNAIFAFLWPLWVLDRVGPFLGGSLLAAGWWGYGRFVAPHFARLFNESSGEKT